MTIRERFFKQMDRNPDIPTPNLEFGYWETTLSQWHKQGLPEEINCTERAYRYFGIEGLHFDSGYFFANFGLRLCPGLESGSLGIKDGRELLVNADGVKFARFPEGQNTIPHYLDYPIKGRREWEDIYKPKLQPDSTERYKEPDWEKIKRMYALSGKPVCLYLDSYLGYLRNLMGFERFAVLPYDDIDLLEDMVETLTRIKESILDRVYGKIRIDLVQYWEDICYGAGPIVQPKAFRDIVVPRMKRVNDRLRSDFACKFISLDCDGNFLALIDGWIEAGVNILMPCEVDAGMDINMLQERYDGRCGFMGGIQKKALIEGKEQIENELLRVLPAAKRGGYIPHLDHSCPANVLLDNYRYYVRMKREILGCG